MGMFDSISARLGGLGIAGPAMRGGIQKVLTKDDGTPSTSGNIACTTDSWARIFTYQVKPQTTHRWGFGEEGRPQTNLGIFYFLPKADTTATMPCAVRVAVVNSEDIVKDYYIASIRSEKLTKQLSDGKELVQFVAERGYTAVPYDKLVIEILVDVAATYAGTTSSLQIDSTLYI